MKTRQEYMQTTGEQAPEPTEFLNFEMNSLDDLQNSYLKKQEEAGNPVKKSELNTIYCFIDFLKGLLNLDPK